MLDTNVLVAAYATEGACMRLFRHCVAHHTVVTSPRLIAELEEKMLRKLRIEAADVASAIAELRGEVEQVLPGRFPRRSPVIRTMTGCSRPPSPEPAIASSREMRICSC